MVSHKMKSAALFFAVMGVTGFVTLAGAQDAPPSDVPSPDAQTQNVTPQNTLPPDMQIPTTLPQETAVPDAPSQDSALHMPPLEAQIHLQPAQVQTQSQLQSQTGQPQSGQAPYEATPAAQELVGDWALIPVPGTIQPKAIRINPWPAQCQWFMFAANGAVKSFDRMRAPCEEMTATAFERAVALLPPAALWRYDAHPAEQKAFMLFETRDALYGESWEAHVVTQDFSRDGADFKAGDLLLYLTNMKTRQIVWIRHLRRLG